MTEPTARLVSSRSSIRLAGKPPMRVRRLEVGRELGVDADEPEHVLDHPERVLPEIVEQHDLDVRPRKRLA